MQFAAGEVKGLEINAPRADTSEAGSARLETTETGIEKKISLLYVVQYIYVITMKQWLFPILFLIGLNFFGCDKKQNVKQVEKQQIQNVVEKAHIALLKKYNAYSNEDMAHTFTYELQDMFIGKRPLCLEGEVKDVVKLDSLYYIMV